MHETVHKGIPRLICCPPFACTAPKCNSPDPLPRASLPEVAGIEGHRIACMPALVVWVMDCQVATQHANELILQQTRHYEHARLDAIVTLN